MASVFVVAILLLIGINSCNGFKVFIGIFSAANDTLRRNIHRDYLQFCPKSFEYKFFIYGQLNPPEDDVILLKRDKYTNASNLKDFLDAVSEFTTVTHIGKIDIYTFINCYNLVRRLDTISRLPRLFYGRPFNWMDPASSNVGMLSIITADLVYEVRSLLIKNHMGPENRVFGYIIQKLYGMTYYREDESHIYDGPISGKPWSHGYTENTIAIHRLNKICHLINAIRTFIPEM